MIYYHVSLFLFSLHNLRPLYIPLVKIHLLYAYLNFLLVIYYFYVELLNGIQAKVIVEVRDCKLYTPVYVNVRKVL